MSDEIIGRVICRSCVVLKLFFGIGGSIMMGNKKPGPEWARFLFPIGWSILQEFRLCPLQCLQPGVRRQLLPRRWD